MISLIVGNKGSGKTKKLIDRINTDAKKSDGALVCIDKGTKLTYDINYVVRLVDADHYKISSFEALYGFICGLCAGNYDITHLYVDAILKIGGRDLEALGMFFDKVAPVLEEAGAEMVLTVSCDESDLPETVKKYL